MELKQNNLSYKLNLPSLNNGRKSGKPVFMGVSRLFLLPVVTSDVFESDKWMIFWVIYRIYQ